MGERALFQRINPRTIPAFRKSSFETVKANVLFDLCMERKKFFLSDLLKENFTSK